jgi:hypothetical protein
MGGGRGRRIGPAGRGAHTCGEGRARELVCASIMTISLELYGAIGKTPKPEPSRTPPSEVFSLRLRCRITENDSSEARGTLNRLNSLTQPVTENFAPPLIHMRPSMRPLQLAPPPQQQPHASPPDCDSAHNPTINPRCVHTHTPVSYTLTAQTAPCAPHHARWHVAAYARLHAPHPHARSPSPPSATCPRRMPRRQA